MKTLSIPPRRRASTSLLVIVMMMLISSFNLAQAQPGWNELQSTVSIFHKSLTVSPNSDVAYYGTLQGEIYKSTNFGGSWTKLSFSNGGVPVNDLYFVNDATGFAVSGNTIWKTTNGGTSWTSQLLGSGFEFNKIKFSGATGFAVGTGGKMYKSTDTGGSWSSVTTNTTTNINSLVITSSEVLIVGEQGLYRKFNISSSTWTNQDKGVSLYDVKVINNKYVAVGANGGILVDGSGKTSGTTATLKSVVNAGSYGVFVCGTNGVIIKSTASLLDSWTSSPSGKTSELLQIAAGTSTGDAMLVLSTSTFLRSYNGGVCQAPAITTHPQPLTICATGTITLSAQNSGTAASWQWRKNGVNVSGQTKQVLTINNASSAHAGNYDVVVSSPCGNATSNTVAVTINSTPTPSSIVGPGTTSVGISSTYSVSAIAGATFNWNAGSGGTVTGSGNSVQLSWSEGGVKTIAVTATDACGTSAERTLSISVGNCAAPSQPAFNPAAPTTGCQGQSSNFSVTAVAGVNYTWTLSGGGTISGSGNSAVVNWTSAGSQTVTVTPSNACGNGIVRTATVTVSGTPSQPSTITGSAIVCSGVSTPYSVTSVAGVTYSWSTGGAGTITGSGNAIGVTWTSAGARTLTVTPSTACGVGTARSLAVTVNAVPAQPSVVAGSTSVTVGTSNQYSVTNESGVTYSWNAGSGGTVTGSGNAVSISWSTSGAKTITVTPSNTCGSGTARTLNVTANDCVVPTQPSVISGSSTSCLTSSAVYSVTNTGGISYNWDAGANGTVSGSGNSVTLSWTTVGSKTVTVTPFNACGNGTPRTLAVTVSQLPSQPSSISGNATVCKDASIAYSVTNVAGVTYTWDTDDNGTVTGSGNSVNIAWTTPGAQTLKVIPSNACGNGTERTLNITVNKVPDSFSGVAGAVNVCANSAQPYQVVNTAGVTYTWSVGADGSFSGGTSASGNITWTSGGVKTVSVTPSNSCGSGTGSSINVSVTTVPSQPSAITGSSSAIAGVLGSYSVTNVVGVTYAWSGGSGATVSGSGNEVQISWSTVGSKTITVTATNFCGTSTSRTTTVNVTAASCTPTAAPVFTSSPDLITATNFALPYEVSEVSGATDYIFSSQPSAGVTISGTGASRTISYASIGKYSISVVAVKDCGGGQFAYSVPVVVNVTVCQNPQSIPTGLSGPTSVCRAGTSRYTVDLVDGLTYEFIVQNGRGTITNVANGIIDVTWTDGISGAGDNIGVRAKNACNIYSFYEYLAVTISPLPYDDGLYLSPPAPVCQGAAVAVYRSSTVGTTTYSWDAGGPGTISGDNTNVVVTVNSSRTVKAYGSNSCGSNVLIGTIIIDPVQAPSQPGPVSGASTVNVNVNSLFSVTSQGTEVDFSWSAGGDATITTTGNSHERQISWSTGGTKTITVQATNSCGTSTARTYSLYVNGPCDQPLVPSSITGPDTGCSGVEYTFSVPFQANTTFSWSAGGDATITGSGTTRTIKWSTSGSKQISVTATNLCTTSSAQLKSVTINSAPAQPAGITGGSLQCLGSIENFSVSSVTAGVNYTWEVSGGTFTNSGTQDENIAITWTSAATNLIKVKATNTCGNSSVLVVDRIVNTTPEQPSLISGEAEVCSSTSKPYAITNVSGVTYSWNGGTVTGSGNAVNISWSSTGAKIITVTPSNACGSGTARTLSVTAIGVPAQPATISGAMSPVLGNSEAYSVTSVAGVSYAWSLSDKGVLNGSGNNSIVAWNTNGSATLSVTPSNACGNGTVRSANITVNKIAQTITFTVASPVVANQSVTLNGTASSGLPITYVSSNNSIAEVIGNELVIKGAGSISITASQAGDGSFTAASNVIQPITINKADQTITFNALSAKTFGSGDFELDATSTSGLLTTYSSSNTAVATVTGNTVSIVGAGSANITASQGGDAIYNSATPVMRALTVNKADQTIVFEPLAAVGISDPPFSLTATASSGLAVSYSSSNTAVATVSGSMITIVGQGSTTITASQAGNTNYNAAVNVQQTLEVISQTRTIGLSGVMSFGETIIGVGKQEILTISNTGNSSMAITDITYPAGFSGSTTGNVEAGGSLQIAITFNPTEAISYAGNIVVASNATGGVNEIAVEGIGVLVTSADSPLLTVNNVYPNPSSGELMIEITGRAYTDVKEVILYDQSGKRVSLPITTTLERGTYRCELNSLREGIYMLALPGQKSAKRIVKIN
jgi:hypothetical protein